MGPPMRRPENVGRHQVGRHRVGRHRVAFIRAPRITRIGEDVQVLGTQGADPVAVRAGLVSALTFHPEVTGTPVWHREWLSAAGVALGVA